MKRTNVIDYKYMDSLSPEEKMVYINNSISKLNKIVQDILIYDNPDMYVMYKLQAELNDG